MLSAGLIVAYRFGVSFQIACAVRDSRSQSSWITGIKKVLHDIRQALKEGPRTGRFPVDGGSIPEAVQRRRDAPAEVHEPIRFADLGDSHGFEDLTDGVADLRRRGQR